MSIAGLVLGLIAMGLASIPALAFDQPLMNPFAEPEKEDPPRPEPIPEREGGLTLKYKNFSVNVGGNVPEKEEEVEEPPPELKLTQDPAKWFTIGAIGTALVAILIALISHHLERHTALTASTIGCSVAAIMWQYFAIGIAFGAAAAFLIVLAILASIFSPALS